MADQGLIKLIKKGIDAHPILSKEKKSELKKEIDRFPECVSINTILQGVEPFTGPLDLQGSGNDPNYKTPSCGTQSCCNYCERFGRRNQKECFIYNHY